MLEDLNLWLLSRGKEAIPPAQLQGKSETEELFLQVPVLWEVSHPVWLSKEP